MLSVSFTTRSVDAGFAEALRWHLAPFRRSEPETQAFPVDLFVQQEDEDRSPPRFSFFVASTLRYRRSSLTELLRFALWELHASVPRRARDFLFLHAGSVVLGSRAMLLPAEMDAGKSSLTVALLQRGARYLSDELASVDPVTAHAYPFPKRIWLDESGLRLFPDLAERLQDRTGLSAGLSQRYLRPEDLGSRTGDPAPVRWLVFPTADWDGPPRLTPIRRAAAVQRMAERSLNLYRYGERGLVLLGRVATASDAYRLTGGTPAQRADLLLERFS